MSKVTEEVLFFTFCLILSFILHGITAFAIFAAIIAYLIAIITYFAVYTLLWWWVSRK